MDPTVEFFPPDRRARCLRVLFLLAWACLGAFCSRTWADESVELSWDPSPNDNVVAYNVYYGTTSRVYTNSIRFSDLDDVVIDGLEAGVTYYFAVTAVNAFGLESPFSNEAYYTVPVPDGIVLQAQAAAGSQAAQLAWTPSPDTNTVGYYVYYGTESGFYTDQSYLFTGNDAVIHGLEGGMTTYFAVTAVDASGNQGAFSNEASLAVPVPAPMTLKTQTITDDSGNPYLLFITAEEAVSGYWEIQCSTDLQNWQPLVSGYGYGNGDGYDVFGYVFINTGQPQMFFRANNY